jgi:hypothetical protein
MTEEIKEPIGPQYTREELVEAYKGLREKFSVESPDDLDLSDPEVAQVSNMMDEWAAQVMKEAAGSGVIEDDIKASLNITTLMIDAGFSDPDYLEEVTDDFLAQDLQRAQDAGLTDLAGEIQRKIDEIKAKLS